MNMLNKQQKDEIGFTYIIDRLEFQTPFGAELKRSIKSYSLEDKSSLLFELNQLETVILFFNSYRAKFKEIQRIFRKIRDINGTLKSLQIGQVLEDTDFFEIKQFAIRCNELLEIISASNLKIDTLIIQNTIELVKLLNPTKQIVPTFSIYEEYSQKLREIRENKRDIEKKIIKTDIHEEKELLMSERLEFVLMEADEEKNIRNSLTDKTRQYVKILKENSESIAKLDFLMAKAVLADEMKAVKPIITDDEEIEIIQAENPVVIEALSKSCRKFTPIDITLKNGVAVLTGANMGGKTVAIKTVILNVVLALSGFYVPANSIRLPCLDFITVINGDKQSMEHGLSSFGAEILCLNDMIKNVKNGTGLVVLDEFARSTNPVEGYCFVKAICKFLSEKSSISLVSTHYDGINDEEYFKYRMAGFVHNNNSTEPLGLKELASCMDYRILLVDNEEKVPHEALNIATMLNLDREIINLVKEVYNDEESN